MLRAGILKKPIPPTEKKPAEGKWLFNKMPSLALAGSVMELGVMVVWREDSTRPRNFT